MTPTSPALISLASNQGHRSPIAGLLSIVIPAYNETSILRSSVDQLLSALDEMHIAYEMWLCQNGSSDGTAELCGELAEERDEIFTLNLDEADYGAALRAGLTVARGQWVATFDADYYDLDFLKAALGMDADIVVGSKQLPNSEDDRPLSRRLVSRSFSWTVRKLLGVHLSETHGMKLFSNQAISRLVPHVRSTKDLFDTELLARAERANLSVLEVPVRTIELRPSRSPIAARVPRTVLGLLRLAFRIRLQPERTDLRNPILVPITPIEETSSLVLEGTPSRRL